MKSSNSITLIRTIFLITIFFDSFTSFASVFNLIPNPGFEIRTSKSSFQSWLFYSSSPGNFLSYDRDSYQGKYAAQIHIKNDDKVQLYCLPRKKIKAGVPYELKLQFKQLGHVRCIASIQCKKENGEFKYFHMREFANLKQGEWNKVSFKFKTEEVSEIYKVIIQVTKIKGRDAYLYLDNINLNHKLELNVPQVKSLSKSKKGIGALEWQKAIHYPLGRKGQGIALGYLIHDTKNLYTGFKVYKRTMSKKRSESNRIELLFSHESKTYKRANRNGIKLIVLKFKNDSFKFNGRKVNIKYKNKEGYIWIETRIPLSLLKASTNSFLFNANLYVNEESFSWNISEHRKKHIENLGIIYLNAKEESFCLTGNPPDEKVNTKINLNGRYTYYDGRTNSFRFPFFNKTDLLEKKTGYHEPGYDGGWVPFNKGKLVDNNFDTVTGMPYHKIGLGGWDIVFDLGEECFIENIETFVHEEYLRNLSLYCKSNENDIWTLVKTYADRVAYTKDYPPFLPNNLVTQINTTARWIRLGCLFKSLKGGFSEIRLWGKPIKNAASKRLSTKKAAIKPYYQMGGQWKYRKPKELIKNKEEKTPVFPILKKFETSQGYFKFNERTAVLLPVTASERTRRTIEIFLSDLEKEYGLILNLVDKVSEKNKNTVDIHPVKSNHTKKINGYQIRVTENNISIKGNDEKGLFYGTQTLMQLFKRYKKSYRIRSCNILDWPDKLFRISNTDRVPDQGYIKAMGRYKVTHVGLISQESLDAALKHNLYARDRFIQYLPNIMLDFLWAIDPEKTLERDINEKVSDLGEGRRNFCPSDPMVWKRFYQRIDKYASLNGDIININLDEREKPMSGSRWNVCHRCRSKHLSGHELWGEVLKKVYLYLKKSNKKVMFSDSLFFQKGISNDQDAQNDWRKIPELLNKEGLSKEMYIFNWHFVDKRQTNRAYTNGLNQLAFYRAPPNKVIGKEFCGILIGGSQPFKAKDSLGISQVCWSPNKALPKDKYYKETLNKTLEKWNALSEGTLYSSKMNQSTTFFIDIDKVANRSFIDQVPSDGKGFCDFGPNYDLRSMSSGNKTLGGTPYNILGGTKNCVMVHNRKFFNKTLPSKVEIPVGKKAASINFLHTMDARLNHSYLIRRELVGYYIMVYEDGSYAPLELKYAINICNFDGLNSFWGWDYAPKGEAMIRAKLVWRGQTGSGVEAHLYSTEWVNPNPSKVIKKIIFTSTWKPVGANPILIALTGTRINESNFVQPAMNTTQYIRKKDGRILKEIYRESRLAKVTPVGQKIDLQKGTLVSDHLWKTDSGINWSYQGKFRNKEAQGGTTPYYTNISLSLYDNNQWPRSEYGFYKLEFPEAKRLSGVSLTGSYRYEDSEVDFLPENLFVYYQESEDGKTWSQLRKIERDMYTPEEEGPVWIPFYGKSLKGIKFRIINRKRTNKVNIFFPGISYIEVYESN